MLSIISGSDKNTAHLYTQHYAKHFARYRSEPIKLLEIGIGGYNDTASGGNSLRMWRTYFSRGMIYGIDIFDKRAHDERRIKTFCGSQADYNFLADVAAITGRLDIVIDDR